MGATFSRVKTWGNEVVLNTDLNAEFDNILNNLGPAGIDDYSTNAAAMKLQTNPGTVGAESLATSLAGELERLRYVLAQIKGSAVSYWYDPATTSLTDLANAVSGGFPDNRISSGKSTGNSSQLVALVPSNTTTSITLDGAPTPFVYYVDGAQYSITADVTVAGLSAAPSSNNTAVFGDTQVDGSQYTGWLGEYGTALNLSAAGSEIASRVGQFAAFQCTASGTTEYFLGYINSTSQITKAWRGCFFDSTQAAKPRITPANGTTVTLLKAAWIFATTSSSMAVTYTTPIYAATEPSAPNSGDYWYDLTNQTWKIYNSTTWVAANATLIGMSAQTSAACVAARTFDKFISVSDTNTMRVEWLSNTVVQARDHYGSLNVFGTSLGFGVRPLQWDMASHLDAGVTEAASTYYYFYVKESGAPVISNKAPTDMYGTRRGLYHPTETWRCIATAFNDASQNLLADTIYNFGTEYDRHRASPNQSSDYRINATVASSAMTVQVRNVIGDYPSLMIPTRIPFRHATATVGGYASNRILTTMPEITVGSSSIVGHGNSRSCPIFIYLMDNGTYNLGVTSSHRYNLGGIIATLAIGSTGTADSGTAMYTNVSQTAPGTLLGHLIAPQSTAGIWTAAPTTISVGTMLPHPEYTYNSFADIAAAGDGAWPAIGGSNAITMDPGTWEIFAQVQAKQGANVITETRMGIYGADGTGTGSTPALVSTLTGATIIIGMPAYSSQYDNASTNNQRMTISTFMVCSFDRTTTVYLDFYSDNSGNGVTHDGQIYARRVRFLA